MIIKAEGLLRHRFFGEYSAAIALIFQSNEHAVLAHKLLGDEWKVGKKDTSVLVWEGDSKSLTECKKLLGKFGADENKIDSIKKSIDYGEKFCCTFQVKDPRQLEMF